MTNVIFFERNLHNIYKDELFLENRIGNLEINNYVVLWHIMVLVMSLLTVTVFFIIFGDIDVDAYINSVIGFFTPPPDNSFRHTQIAYMD